MNPRLRALMIIAGVTTFAGGTAVLLIPRGDVTLNQLRNAGLGDGQPFVLVCPEKLSPETRRKINLQQPDFLRVRQRYARIARAAVCFRTDGGAAGCFRPDGTLLPGAEAQVIVPSLRILSGDSGIDPTADDGVPLQADCRARRCSEFDAGFCQGMTRIEALPLPCVIPDCRIGQRWNDNAIVDCRATGRLGHRDGGARWRGCNVMPSAFAVGTACVAVECGTLAPDDMRDEL